MSEQPADLAKDEWGRVAADGTVYVRTPDGERAVGDWQADDPQAGLTLFIRRYDDLAARVALLERRVRTATAKPADARKEHAHLSADVANANAVGDLAALAARLTELVAEIDALEAKTKQQKQEQREQAAADKRAIVAEAEVVLRKGNFRRGTEHMAELVERWKALPRLDRSTDDQLWQSFSAVRTQFTKARKAHFAELSVKHEEAERRKKRLIAEAEALSGSTDWAETSRAYRDLMQQWKAAGPAARGVDDRLWKQFRAAQDTFFQARDAANKQRDDEQQANLRTKEALLVEAEALLPVKDLAAAKEALRDIQARWEAAGHVPRSAMKDVENRIRRVERAIADAERDEWRRSDPETTRRASSTADQLRRSIADLEAQLAKAQAAGDQRAIGETEKNLQARRAWLEQAEKLL